MKTPVVPGETSLAIDRTRGLAALGVLWGHSMYGLGLPIELNGAFWVWVFLPLSGYLVARGFGGGAYPQNWAGAGRFLWNRGLRILPLAWFALAIGAIVAATTATLPADTLRQFLFVPARNVMTLVGPLWTVATELQFYVVAALVLPWLYRGGVGGRIAVAFAALLLALWGAREWMTLGWDNEVQPRGLVPNLPFFIWGILLAAVPAPPIRIPGWMKTLLLLGLVVWAWYLQNHRVDYFWRWGPHKGFVFGGAAAIALAVTWVVIWIGSSSHTSVTRWPLVGAIASGLAWCGVHTYGIYVYHALLLVVNNALLHVPTGWLRLLWLLLALPLAAISYRMFEGPLLRFKIGRSA